MSDREHDPNHNPIWDYITGENTNEGTVRVVGIVVMFIIAGGSVFYLLG